MTIRIRIAVIDLSALPQWPAQATAARDVYEAADQYYALRMIFGEALAPSPFQMLRFAPSILGIVHVE